jgi:hypothetical protein
MNAALVLAQAAVTETEAHSNLPSKWAFGAVALVVLLLLLFIVTRLNVDR